MFESEKIEVAKPIVTPKAKNTSTSRKSIFVQFLDLLSSVRFGVTLLIVLGLLCFLGMVIMQQNVDGFQQYFDSLTPAQQLVYGKLGLFNVYHVWYFNALLAVLSLNIILASVERFPKTWRFVTHRTVAVPIRWMEDQKPNALLKYEGTETELDEKIRAAAHESGYKKIRTAERGGRKFYYFEKGAWNRLGAYPVHVGLLTIFLGGFLTSQLGHTGQMALAPGQTSNVISEMEFNLNQLSEVQKMIPFQIECEDIQQRLIKEDGPINAGNTIDWITKIKINDEYGAHEGIVQMNKPLDYRGYRFFQSSFVPVGKARNITLSVRNEAGNTQTVQIARDQTTTLEDGTKVEFANFRGRFSVGEEDPNEDTSAYPNPAAVLLVTPKGGAQETAYAFGKNMQDIPVAKKPVGGYFFRLDSFEKVSAQHVLSVQRDPGATVVYIGFVILAIALIAVFFFSHRRIWTVVEQTERDTYSILLAANSNRNQAGLEENFNKYFNNLSEDLAK